MQEIKIDKKLGVCKVCGLFYKCKPSDFPMTKYCSRKCQLKDYGIRDRSNELVNRVFGKLHVVRFDRKDEHRNYLWVCECECGNRISVNTSLLKSKRKTHCGCSRKSKEI